MAHNGREQRILVLAPIGRDGRLTRQVLRQAGFSVTVCNGMDEVCRELAAGVGALLLTDESLDARTTPRLIETLSRQPSWSEIPLVVLTSSRGMRSRVRALRELEPLGNVSFLERPLSTMTLVSTLRMSLRARNRQYEIRELLGRLEDGMRQRDDFMAMLAHELRNPLAPIRNAVELLRRQDSISPSDLQWATELLDRQSQQLARMVDDLLDVSRITRGKVTLNFETVDLRTVVERAVETSRPLIESRKHRLAVVLPPQRLPVRADVVRLSQAITNLLNNAAKYTDEGGSIEVRAGQTGSMVEVTVCDSGVGMTPELRARVFEPFTQGQRSTKVVHAGLGLGLAVVRSLIELHNGTVHAASDGPGCGSKFSLRMPLQRQPDVSTTHAQTPTDGPRRRILIVEDNRDAADSLAMLLRMAGHEVQVAHDGPIALEMVQEFQPEAILLDIGLPSMSGYEVAQRVRADDRSQIRLIALSGYGQAQDRQRSTAAGFDEHLLKPVRLQTIEQALARLS